jgi:hypothetical protein
LSRARAVLATRTARTAARAARISTTRLLRLRHDPPPWLLSRPHPFDLSGFGPHTQRLTIEARHHYTPRERPHSTACNTLFLLDKMAPGRPGRGAMTQTARFFRKTFTGQAPFLRDDRNLPPHVTFDRRSRTWTAYGAKNLGRDARDGRGRSGGRDANADSSDLCCGAIDRDHGL